MSDDSALKPCPFCGGKAKLVTGPGGFGDGSTRGECRSCYATGPSNYEPSVAAAKWNRRAPDQRAEDTDHA